MNRRTRKIAYFSISLVFIVLLGNSYATLGIDTEFNLEQNEYAKVAYDLFKSDPTNPTQVLKYKYLSENSQPVSDLPKLSVPVKTDVIDEVQDFWMIDSFESYPYTYVKRSAQLLAIGANSYVYILNSLISYHGLSNARAKAEDWRDEFETTIYPNDVLYFGDPDGYLGDIDGDSHITILISDLDGGVAGYFDPNNEGTGPTSNQREMVYVDYDTTYGVLAHEFQHLIHFNHDEDEFWWVDEGCAELAKYLNGYDVTNNLTVFARDYFAHNVDDSLLYWNYESIGGKDVRIDYGGAYLFIFYLAEKYGVDAITFLVNETAGGALGVENALANVGYIIEFNDLFLNWATALYVDDTSFGGGLYGFTNLDIMMDYELISTVPTSEINKLNRFYGLYVAKLNSPPDYLMFEPTDPASTYLGMSFAVHDMNGWTVTKSIQDTDIVEFLNGTLVDEVYIITSLMAATTPIIPVVNQFGLGTTDYIDFTLLPGSPLTVDSFSYNYVSGNWNFSLYNVVILDENSTPITDSSGVDVYVQFQFDGSSTIYTILAMNYSVSLDWYITLSLQSFDEATYDVSIIASGSSQYGESAVDLINVDHILAVEEPSFALNSESTGIYVRANASYTQLDAWNSFSENVLVMILLYDSQGVPVDAFSMLYNPSTNDWESGLIDLSMYFGNYHIKVSFRYAGRTVKSVVSDTFAIKGNPLPTASLDFSFWMGIIVISIGISIVTIKRRSKR
ncbi:MAG: M48 family metallopeptidase [Candidatus Heimdallarchaeota archaeon]|nr:M48 family metallopeptidase [Candidatus Heimdallarchaeota archaeon]MCG3256972.1 M48 family metallopeptidase [Candidatus Heimdallarchaeota archaeon]MCK4612035.1 M48 family metallopeptidase [Candidatus Heimdallarchaeota archaeon]